MIGFALAILVVLFIPFWKFFKYSLVGSLASVPLGIVIITSFRCEYPTSLDNPQYTLV